MMKKSLVGLVVVLLIITACDIKPLNPSGGVTYWANKPDPELVTFAATVPGLTFTEAANNTGWVSQLADPSGAPDLIFTDLSYDVDAAGGHGLLADLTPFRPRLATQAGQWKGLNELVDAGKHPTFLPSTVYLWRLFYNTDVLEKAGVKVPTNLAELEGAFETLKQQSVVPLALGSSFGWPALAWLTVLDLQQNGVAAYRSLVQGTRSFDDASLKPVYETLAKWRDKGWIDPDSGTQNWPEALVKLSDAKAGFTFLGSSAVNRFKGAREIQSVSLSRFSSRGETAQLAGVQGFVVNAKAKAPEAALALADAYRGQGVKGQLDDSFRVAAVKAPLDLATAGIRGPQYQDLDSGVTVVPQLDRELEPQASYDANQAVIRFFAKGSTMTADELAAGLAAAVKTKK